MMPLTFDGPERVQGRAGSRCPRSRDPIEAKSLLAQNLNYGLEFYRVGRQANSSKYDGTGCIEPINPL
jgi:hypothetical protein